MGSRWVWVATAMRASTTLGRPGTQRLVDFTALSRAGGVVNPDEAVRLASAEAARQRCAPLRATGTWLYNISAPG